MSRLVPKLRFKEFSGEWGEKQLKNISSSIFDGTHQTPKYTDDGIPFFSVENIISGNKNKFISIEDYLEATKRNKPERNDILITRIGNIGFSTIVSWDYDFSIYVTLAVVKKSEKFNSYYLHCYFQSPRYQSEILSKSLLNAVPCKINMDELRKTKVLLPKLSEQKKIAACLSSLDNLIEIQNKKVQALKKYKKGLMQGLFPSDGEKEPKLRFKEFSGEWEEKSLDYLTSKISDGIHTTPSYKKDGEYFFINGNNLVNGVISVDNNTKRVTEKEYKKHKRDLNQNTILLSINGTIGNIAIYNNEQVVLGKSACYINIKDNLLNKSFIVNFLKTEKVQNFFTIELTGSTIKNLSLKTIKNTIIDLPKPEEQQKIANTLSSLDNLIEAQNKKIQALKKHKKGLMQQLFVNSEASV